MWILAAVLKTEGANGIQELGSPLHRWGQGSSVDTNMAQQNQQPDVGHCHCLTPRPQWTSMDRAAISGRFPLPWESAGRPLVGRRGLQARESADKPSFSPSKSSLFVHDNSLIRTEHLVF